MNVNGSVRITSPVWRASAPDFTWYARSMALILIRRAAERKYPGKERPGRLGARCAGARMCCAETQPRRGYPPVNPTVSPHGSGVAPRTWNHVANPRGLRDSLCGMELFYRSRWRSRQFANGAKAPRTGSRRKEVSGCLNSTRVFRHGGRTSRPAVTEERGATAVEYALMVALIAVVIILAVTFIGTSASTKFSKVGSAVNSAGS